MRKTLPTMILLLPMITTLVVASNAAAKPRPKEVTLKGTLICLGCQLQSDYGAKAQCSIYGHDPALQTKDGKIYTFLSNDRSKPLLKHEKLSEHLGQKITIHGILFPNTMIIEVKDYQLAEGMHKEGKATQKVRYVCTCGPSCHCNTVSDKPGTCSCGVALKPVEE